MVEETGDARSIVFEVPADAAEQFAYKPGQFLTVAVPSDQTGVAARCYSLCSSPRRGRPARRSPSSGPSTATPRTGSATTSRPGDSLRVLPPSGIFTPADLDADLLLFAGGRGITPIMSITRTALRQGSGRIVLFYANRDESSVIFAERARRARRRAPRPAAGRALARVGAGAARRQDQLKAFAAAYSTYDAFVCGPAPFMKATVDALQGAGVPAGAPAPGEVRLPGRQPVRRPARRCESAAGRDRGRRHRRGRRRATPPRPAAAGSGQARGRARRRDHTFDDWQPGTKLLEFLESKGVKAPYSCREGECSACAFRLLEGEVRMLAQRRARRRGPRRRHPPRLPVRARHRHRVDHVPLTTGPWLTGIALRPCETPATACDPG